MEASEKQREKDAESAWEQHKRLLIERDQARRGGAHLQLKQGVAAAPKTSVVTLQRQRLERSLNASPAMPEATIAQAPAPTSETKGHSRVAKGECGERIGRKIDKLIAEIQHEETCESACCAAPLAVIERPSEAISDVVDPPVGDDCGGVVITEGQPVEFAAGGGTSGFPNEGTAWDAFSGQGELMSDIGIFLQQLDSDPRLRSSSNLRSLSRVRGELERIPESASMGDSVQLTLHDVVVLMDQCMRRMR